MALLNIKNLGVEFGTMNAPFIAFDGLDLLIDVGEVVGIVGEFGSGKIYFASADGLDRLFGAGKSRKNGVRW